ncbi:hypothetical protein L249_0123 [Ophiocordyceps polyrhachis-furcata BCC 54312]|uniref:Uncharacterized protein n=1 Tax=Ophiocordyceps polyrhachis-furcata BCC 54312 TaxID=1330021 RepID=A0A367LFP5_9HYPO|nr:hypothetical protein L249_0123 [Ophiocordyceps polyrhachis-furcata BCC 54312]
MYTQPWEGLFLGGGSALLDRQYLDWYGADVLPLCPSLSSEAVDRASIAQRGLGESSSHRQRKDEGGTVRARASWLRHLEVATNERTNHNHHPSSMRKLQRISGIIDSASFLRAYVVYEQRNRREKMNERGTSSAISGLLG